MGVGPSANVFHPNPVLPPVQSNFTKYKPPDCLHYTHRSNRAELNASTWAHAQETYNLFLRTTSREHDEFDVDPMTREWPAPHRHTLKVKYNVGFQPHEGHVVYAAERIPKGTLVYSDVDKGVFRSEEEFHQFLTILNDERLACYIVLNFGNVMEDGSNSSVAFQLDESALVVPGNFVSDDNIGFISKEKNNQSSTTAEYYALRDIEVGEEIALSRSIFDEDEEEDEDKDEENEEDEDDKHWWNKISCEGYETVSDCWYTSISLQKYEDDYQANMNWDETPDWIVGKEFKNFKLPDCDSILKAERTIFTQELWDKYQEKYGMFVRSTRPYNEAEADPVTKEWPQKIKKSFEIDYEIKISPGKGRGVFSKENVTEGTLVYKHQACLFRTDDEFLQYLSLLTDEMACDVMEWSTVVLELDGNYALSFEAHDAALLNSGDTLDDHNIGLPFETSINATETYIQVERVATHVIREGEELLDDYHAYILDDYKLSWFLPIKRAFYGITDKDLADNEADEEADKEDEADEKADNEDIIDDKVDKEGMVNTNTTGLLVNTNDCTKDVGCTNAFNGEPSSLTGGK